MTSERAFPRGIQLFGKTAREVLDGLPTIYLYHVHQLRAGWTFVDPEPNRKMALCGTGRCIRFSLPGEAVLDAG